MFDLGWQEFLMVAIVLMLVVGPKDMPKILRSFSQFMRKAKSMANEFTSSLEDVARNEEIKEMTAMMKDVKSGNLDDVANMIGGDVKEIASDLKQSANLDDMADEVKDIQAASAKPKKAKPKNAKSGNAKPAAKTKIVAKKTAKKAAKKS